MKKPSVTRRSKKSQCFYRIGGAKKITEFAYFSDPKSWMQITIMENILQNFNCQMISENRKVMPLLESTAT